MKSSSKIRRSFVPILTGCDLSRRRLPMMIAEGEASGPTVWLTGCAHGDEVGGIVVIHEIFQKLKHLPLKKGIVNAFPLMNPIGFDACSRQVIHSEEDLNRSFPGHSEGTLAERIAGIIFTKIVKSAPDLVLDLHNDWNRAIPYVVLDGISPDRPDVGIALKRARDVAVWSGFPLVSEPNPLRRSLSHSLLEHSIPALTFELGESRVVNEENVALGVAAIWAIFAGLGMVDSSGEKQKSSPGHSPMVYSSRPRCSTSGIIRFRCHPGQIVKPGDLLAWVEDAFGRKIETLRSESSALVLGISDSSVAYPGAPVVALGVHKNM